MSNYPDEANTEAMGGSGKPSSKEVEPVKNNKVVEFFTSKTVIVMIAITELLVIIALSV